jgi:hypothetical protein
MWKPRKEDEQSRPAAPNVSPSYTPIPPKEVRPMDPKSHDSRTEVAHIGKSVVIKGELSGSAFEHMSTHGK